MESRNPVFARSEEFQRGGYATFDTRTPDSAQLEEMYGSPSATSVDTGRMTIDDVVMRTARSSPSCSWRRRPRGCWSHRSSW